MFYIIVCGVVGYCFPKKPQAERWAGPQPSLTSMVGRYSWLRGPGVSKKDNKEIHIILKPLEAPFLELI